MIIGLILADLVGILTGATIHAAWTERRHDCLPHDPDRCRDRRPDEIEAGQRESSDDT